MSKTTIEWTDYSWNPLVAVRNDDGKVGFHCEKVSPACTHCYAEAFNARKLPARGTGLPYTRASRDQVTITLDAATLAQPLHWKRPRRIFVCSMTDLFAEFVPFELIDQVFAVMALSPQHTFQVLTKRPDRMREYLTWCDLTRRRLPKDRPDAIGMQVDAMRAYAQVHGIKLPRWNPMVLLPFDNVCLGTTVEMQEFANLRIPELLRCPAAVRFVSYEPALGLVDFRNIAIRDRRGNEHFVDSLTGVDLAATPPIHGGPDTPRIHGVICGGESGPKARPMHPEWARFVLRQCEVTRTPFLFKQWGAWLPNWDHATHDSRTCVLSRDGVRRSVGPMEGSDALMHYVGKKKAGRLLDGREHSEFPAVAATV
jgi:protein gp37